MPKTAYYMTAAMIVIVGLLGYFVYTHMNTTKPTTTQETYVPKTILDIQNR